MRLYDNDAYREDFIGIVYNLLQDDGTNDRANQIIDAFDLAPEVEIETPPPNDPLTPEQLREMDSEPVKVIRCKDCKNLHFKDFLAFCPHRVSACRPDGFCEYGERRKPEEG